MTGEEMERAIEFLLQSQASFEARMSAFEAQQRRTDEQIAETGKQLRAYAETQSEFIQIVTRNMGTLTTAQAETDARLNKLIGLFEQHVVAGH